MILVGIWDFGGTLLRAAAELDTVDGMKVMAIAHPFTTPQGVCGHDGVALRYAGDIFNMPDGSTGSWFIPYPPPNGFVPPVAVPIAFSIDS